MTKKPTEESAAKKHAHNIRQLNKTKYGREVIEYLVKRSGFYDELGNADQKKQNDRTAQRDFVVRHIIKPINQGD
ncbi:MAG: hypothetical protein ACN2B6_11445 [Rickettsiales bacterium]